MPGAGLACYAPPFPIVRWIDYWDGHRALVQNAVTAAYPTYFKDGVQRAHPLVVSVAAGLQKAFAAGDAAP